jgi:hypothetical protein
MITQCRSLLARYETGQSCRRTLIGNVNQRQKLPFRCRYGDKPCRVNRPLDPYCVAGSSLETNVPLL